MSASHMIALSTIAQYMISYHDMTLLAHLYLPSLGPTEAIILVRISIVS